MFSFEFEKKKLFFKLNFYQILKKLIFPVN
jgi:hypothetical protein